MASADDVKFIAYTQVPSTIKPKSQVTVCFILDYIVNKLIPKSKSIK